MEIGCARRPGGRAPGSRATPNQAGASRPRTNVVTVRWKRRSAGGAPTPARRRPPLRSSGVASTTASYPPITLPACAAPGRFRLRADRSHGCPLAAALRRRGRRPPAPDLARASGGVLRAWQHVLAHDHDPQAENRSLSAGWSAGAGQGTQCEPA